MLKIPVRVIGFVLLAVFTVSFGVAHSAWAQDAAIIANLKKPITVFNEITDEDFFEKTVLYKEVPSNDAFLEYEVRLPRNWTQSNQAGSGGLGLSNRVLGEVARYYGPARHGERSYFSVRAHALDYQLTAEQWFATFVIENGYTMQGMNVLGDNRIEALYVLVEGDVTYVVRAVARMNGKRIILAQHVVQGEAFIEERGVQEKVMSSFKLLAPDTSFVENMKTYKFLDIAEFSYPESWFVRGKKVRTIDNMEAAIYRVTKREITFFDTLQLLTGKIGIHAMSAYVVTDVEEQIETFKKEIEGHGLVFKETIEEPDDFNFNKDINFGHVEVHKVVSEKERLRDYEYWVALMNSGEYYYFVTLLTPARDNNFDEWARNTQTFRVVAQLVGPQKDSRN